MAVVAFFGGWGGGEWREEWGGGGGCEVEVVYWKKGVCEEGVDVESFGRGSRL